MNNLNPNSAANYYDSGAYLETCIECKYDFFGNKNAFLCKLCAARIKKKWDELSPEEQQEKSQKVMADIAAFWEDIKKEKK